MFYKTLFAVIFSTALLASPTPWLAPKAIKILEEHLRSHPDAKVLEYGSGRSTIWFAQRTRNLYSVEHHEGWYHKVLEIAEEAIDCHPFHYFLLETPYYEFSYEFEDAFFDIILVDGRNRKGCVAHCLTKLKPGGLLMLDDSERTYYHSVFPLLMGWKGNMGRRTDTKYDPCVTRWWFKPEN